MTIGAQFATLAYVEAMRRKLERMISGMGIDQHGADSDVGSVENFIDLADCPQTYSTYTGRIPTVNAAEDGLEWNPYVLASATSPVLTIRNNTDSDVDPVLRFAVGATPVARWTQGLDDSLSHDWLLCAGDILTDTVTEETYTLEKTLDGYLVICDSGNFRIKKHLSSDGTYQAKIGSNGSGNDQFNTSWGVCSDGTNVYVTDSSNDRIKKHLLSNLSYVAQIGSTGSGNDQFNTPRGICTDGTYLYVVDKVNDRVVKRLCSDLSYVAETAGPGFNNPDYICTDGTHIYTAQSSGATHRLFKHYCDDLSLDTRVMPAGTDGHIDSATITGMCTTGGYLYLINSNLGGGSLPFYKYSCTDLTYVADFGTAGTGDGQLNAPQGIATDAINLFVTDNNGLLDARVQKFLLDGTYVSHFGTYGSGDDNFFSPRGISVSGIITRTTVTPRRGPILRAAADATSCQSYVSFHFRNESRWRENSVTNANYITLRAPASVTSYDLVWPSAQAGASGYALVNNGSGTLSWSAMTHNLLSATHSDTLTGTVVKGDIIYGNATPKWARLAPNTTATKNFLTETSSVPAWGTIAAGDLPAHQLDGAVHSVSGLTTGHFLKATGATTFAFAAHGLTSASVGAEPALGNPATTGFVLSSTDAGVRSWVANASTFVALTDGPGAFTSHGGQFVKVKVDETALEYVASSVAGHALSSASHTDVDADTPSDNDILRFDTASGTWMNEALPAASNHDLLSATHSDTTAAAVVRGDIIIGSGATPKWTRLAKGTETYVLTMGANEPAWAAPSGGGAPTGAKYIVQEAHADLSAEQSLGALTTGLLKNTVAASVGTLSTATPYVDYSKHCWMDEIFDGLATGDINGLGSYFECGAWVTNNAASCTTTVAVKSGADKMLRCFAPVGAGSARCDATISSTIGASGGFRMRFKMRIDQDQANFSGGVGLADSTPTTTASVRFGYSTGLKIRFYDGTTTTNIQAAVKDTWYQIDMFVSDVSATVGYCRIWIDGVYATSLATGTHAKEWSNIFAYSTNAAGAGDLNFDIDDLQVYSTLPLGLG